MNEDNPAAGWDNVDQTVNPDTFVQYLDDVKAIQVSLAYKQKTFALLNVQKGDHILDVGCGTGEDVITLAHKVGFTGEVVGIDKSETMITRARNLANRIELPVKFHINDAHSLEFAGNVFDGCRADRTFQYLKNPEKALAEMVRVAKSGASIVVSEPDWGTLVIDNPHKELTRKILNFGCDTTPNGWIGRHLPSLFKRCGLIDVAVVPITFVLTDFSAANEVFKIEKTALSAMKKNIISKNEAKHWLKSLKNSSEKSQFFSAIMGFIICGKVL